MSAKICVVRNQSAAHGAGPADVAIFKLVHLLETRAAARLRSSDDRCPALQRDRWRAPSPLGRFRYTRMTSSNGPKRAALPTKGRLRREYRTIESMLQIWCAARHGSETSRSDLCSACAELLAYAGQRLAKCPYGEDKPTCAKCPVHCYRRVQREQVREVMRYAGPRMLWRHPWQALLHILDNLRRAEDPRSLRRRDGQAGE